jgi:hypothetical protein
LQSFIPVSKARDAIRKVIGKGGCASVMVGDEARSLLHSPRFDRPERRFPWPFSKLQPLRFRITRQKMILGEVVVGVQFPPMGPAGPKTCTEYNKSQIEEGIDTLLSGCKPDDEVAISVGSPV